MPFYTKPLSQLDTADLQELVNDGAVENLRLEFKLKVPDKDDTLKKLSSFANTLGGFMVVGAEAEKDGRITGLPGVDVEAGYKQKIVDWCSSAVSPPFYVEISDPIPAPASNEKFCYVIYIAESETAPHFLNGRRGVWVRTDEFSKRFEALLATEAELRQLADRRKLVRDRRANLMARAKKRFNTYAGKPSTKRAERDPLLEVCFIPRFPARPLCPQEDLRQHVQACSIPWRRVTYTDQAKPTIAQHESVLVLNPARRTSIFKVNIWGLLFHGIYLPLDHGEVSGIHIHEFIGCVLLFIHHAAGMFKALGYSGPILLEISLAGFREIKWVHGWGGFPQAVGGSELDDELSFSLLKTTDDLRDKRDGVLIEVLRQVFFSANLPDFVDRPGNLEQLAKNGYEFNVWQMPQTLRV